MRILELNKYFYLKGGAERYLFELTELLERHGHTIIPFAVDDVRNYPTPWASYFVKDIPTEKVTLNWRGIKTAFRIIYSRETRERSAALIKASKPQIAHVQNIYHQLTTSVLDSIREADLPAVMTIHDYRLLSPNYSLYHRGRICEQGIKHPLLCSAHGCLKNSVFATLAAGAETVFTRATRVYPSSIQKFLVPSKFVLGLFERSGWKMDKFQYLPHFIEAKKYRPNFKSGEAVVYFGRLSHEKGLETLLAVAKKLPKVKFQIAGSGPLENRLRSIARQWELNNVEFLGWLEGEELWEVVRNALLVVAPSEWYEIFGLTVLEAMALGKAVIASDIGAYPELIEHEVSGLLAKPGDIESWVKAIESVMAQPEVLEEMGRRGRQKVVEDFSAERHYHDLMEVYKRAMTGG
ncbi:MAG: glycosyltransferase family 4 protein [bacterium]